MGAVRRKGLGQESYKSKREPSRDLGGEVRALEQRINNL